MGSRDLPTFDTLSFEQTKICQFTHRGTICLYTLIMKKQHYSDINEYLLSNFHF